MSGLREAIGKRLSKRDALLALLSDGQWHSALECQRPSVGGSRYSARMGELKDLGYRIERQTLDHQLFHYRLLPGERLL